MATQVRMRFDDIGGSVFKKRHGRTETLVARVTPSRDRDRTEGISHDDDQGHLPHLR